MSDLSRSSKIIKVNRPVSNAVTVPPVFDTEALFGHEFIADIFQPFVLTPTHYWKMKEITGGNTIEEFGSAGDFPFTITGTGVAEASDETNDAYLSFTPGDFVVTSPSIVGQITRVLTQWVRVRSPITVVPPDSQALFHHANSNNMGAQVSRDGADTFEYAYHSLVSGPSGAISVQPTDAWRLFALKSSASNIQASINGGPFTEIVLAGGYWNTNGICYLGSFGSGARRFKGDIGQTALWDNLDDTQIAALYARGPNMDIF